jgi:hypothetical protein
MKNNSSAVDVYQFKCIQQRKVSMAGSQHQAGVFLFADSRALQEYECSALALY